MAENKVLFRAGTWEQYSTLLHKDPLALYWISDRRQIWKGDKLYGTGANATEELAGLMSPEDKRALDALIESGGSGAPVYTLEKQATPENGSLATYRLKRTIGASFSYVGDPVNIPVDRVLSSGTLTYAPAKNNPYPGAEVGDPYLDLVLNDTAATHIYIPVKGLVNNVTAGSGIISSGNLISIKMDTANANGLKVTDAGIGLDLATATSAGAMSAEDKKLLSSISAAYLKQRYRLSDTTSPKPVVTYHDGEIRAMYDPATRWASQQVGSGGDPNRYYAEFRAYAPEGAVAFREYLNSNEYVIPSSIQKEQLEGNLFAGMDEYTRKYSVVWLPVAQLDGGVWTYFGKNSSEDHYVGWYYCVEWYDASGNIIAADTVRINLSNAACHSNARPYYMSEYATKKELRDGLDSVAGGTIEWGNIE